MPYPAKYKITYAQMAIELLPVDKRYKTLIKFIQVCFYPLQYLHDILTGIYYSGSSEAEFVAGSYDAGDRVNYKKSVYESLIDDNTDYPDQPTWYKVSDNFIGLSERILYNGQKIVLEYAINRWFGTTFRQPGSTRSDIYLVTNPGLVNIFRSGGVEAESSLCYSNTSIEFSINSYSFIGIINMVVYVPSAVFLALSNTDASREAIIRSFTDKYIAGGITYTIETY